MSIQLQPSVPLVRLVKTEPPEEAFEKALEKEVSPDIKDLDIVYHPLSEDLIIKNETVPENILETKYSESVETETQVLVKTEDTSDGNVTWGTDQEVIEVQGLHEYSNTLSNLDTQEQLVLNSSKVLNDIVTSIRKANHPKKTNFAKCYNNVATTSREKDKETIKVIKASVIPVEAHEYISLAKDRHVCNHCQHAYNILSSLKRHIEKIHREVTTIYQCPYCPFKSKWSLQLHIIQKHTDAKDIQWFQCNLCEMKFKLKSHLTRHMKKVHLKHKQMEDVLDLRKKRYHCANCDYKTHDHYTLKRHNSVHLKETQYFYCYHCSYKTKWKWALKGHIFRHHFKNVKQGKRYGCYHCSYKTKWKGDLKGHIFRHHFKNVKQGKRYGCNKCDYVTYTSTQLKNHKLNHLKPEEIQYFYCYHCSYKTKRKWPLKVHIFGHFKKEQVKFDCYICNFMTPKRESIIKHIKKHSKVENKSEINEES